VHTGLGAVEFQNKVGEPVDDAGRPPKVRGGVDEAVDHEPGFNPVEISELALEAGEDGECAPAGRLVALLRGDLRTHLTEWTAERAVRV